MFPSPALEPPELEDFQWSLQGLTMGADTPFGVLKVEGLDLATIRSGDLPWARDHGQAAGLDLYDGRDILIDLWMTSNGTSLQSSQIELAAATVVRTNEEVPLWFQLPNLPILCVMCRPRKRPLPIDSTYAAAQVATPELSLHATDPRIYGAGEEEVINLGPLSEGKVTPGTATLENGPEEMRPVIVLTGPLTLPSIANNSIEGDPFLKLDSGVGGFTVKAGDQVLLDLSPVHLARYYVGGVGTDPEPANVTKWITFDSTWWDIIPDVNLLSFVSTDTSETGGTATVQWAPAYQL